MKGLCGRGGRSAWTGSASDSVSLLLKRLNCIVYDLALSRGWSMLPNPKIITAVPRSRPLAENSKSVAAKIVKGQPAWPIPGTHAAIYLYISKSKDAVRDATVTPAIHQTEVHQTEAQMPSRPSTSALLIGTSGRPSLPYQSGHFACHDTGMPLG